MYIKRHIEATVKQITKSKGVLIITGARQVGKSTMLRKQFSGHEYVALDTPSDYMLAKEKPSEFFKKHKDKVILDEIQRAPELFHLIKSDVDELIFRDLDKGKREYAGKYILTGSQSFSLMKNVTESLAGRAGIISMLGLSRREIDGKLITEPFKPAESYKGGSLDYDKTIEIIHRGSFPELYNSETAWSDYYDWYIKTYLEKDVREIINVQNEVAFMKFLHGVAARTGQELNLSALAEVCGKEVNTVKSWLSVLATSGLIVLLQPYFNNATKRMIKTPKMYMLDTGLVCYLGGWDTPKQMINGAMWGAIFETYIVGEVLKSYYNNGTSSPRLYYYRDKEKKEVDLIIEQAGTLYPIEIKTTTDPRKSMCASFNALSKIAGKKIGEGVVICMIDKPSPLTDGVWAINIDQI